MTSYHHVFLHSEALVLHMVNNKNINIWAKKYPELAKQHIRDLYDKLFPTYKDYLQFLKSMYEAQLSLMNIGLILKEQKKEEDAAYWQDRTNNGNDQKSIDNQFAKKDQWKSITPEKISEYEKMIRKWLGMKTPQQQQIWNYYMLGVPKKRIAKLLSKNISYIRVLISELQENFIENIPLFLNQNSTDE